MHVWRGNNLLNEEPPYSIAIVRRFSASQNYKIIPQDSKEHRMAEKLTWDDAEKIGVLLARKHPELYPLSTDLEELQRRVKGLAEFKDTLEILDKNKLE